MHHKLGTALVAATLTLTGSGACLVTSQTAHAAPHQISAKKTTTESFLVAGANQRDIVVAHGLFAGGGKDEQHSEKDVLVLNGGKLTLRHPEKTAHFRAKVNPKTCFVTFHITGDYTLGHGTGKYKGVTGHGTYTVFAQGIGKRLASGACNETADPKVEASYIKASGPVSRS
jgi:hypothetical protein